MRSVRKISIIVLVLFVIGCAGAKIDPQPANPTVTVYKTLVAGKQTYDAAFKTLAVLDYQGKLSKSFKEKAVAAGNAYVIAHNIAVQELLDGRIPDLKTVAAALDAFLQVVAPYYNP